MTHTTHTTRVLRASEVQLPVALPPRAALTGDLHLRGELPRRRGVAVVGTRRPSDEAVDYTRRLAAALVKGGFAVWSGGALGIDAAAHEGALDAGGTTVVVLPCGVDVAFPVKHAPLYAKVLAHGGALVSRLPDGAPAGQGTFFPRNEALVALTEVTVVVQAPFRSGARNAAASARKLGRPVYVVPGAPWDPRAAGCAHELATGGGQAIHDPTTFVGGLGARGDLGDLDEDELKVLGALARAPVHIDEVCDRAGLLCARAGAALLTLTLKAVVVEGPAGFFRRACRS